MAERDADAFDAARRLFGEGVAHFEAGRYADADRAFSASLERLPGRASTLANLGATRLRLGRAHDALVALDDATRIAPGDRDAWFHRADALAVLGRLHDALASVERAIAIDAAHAGSWLRRGELLHRLDRGDDALAAFRRAIELDPAFGLAWSHLGGLLRESGRLGEASAAFERALALGADAPLNRFYLAAVQAAAAPGSAPLAPAGYVRSLFDGYAADYDRHLLGALDYRAHRALVEPLPSATGRFAFGAALDLGCGTGLCGPLLRPMVERLAGVDLSPAMLAEAGKLGVYDALIEGDLLDALRDAGTGSLDLVVAADVFIYIADPKPVLEAARDALAAGGVVALTAERAEGGADVRLLPTLRYAQSAALWPRLAAETGFRVASTKAGPVRSDQGRPVVGDYVWLVRDQAPGRSRA